MRQRVECDTLVIGAGLLGSSTGMHLAQLGLKGPSGVRVVDFDLEGPLSSSELNAGGVRASFSQPINIALSKLSIEYFAAHAADVGYRPVGYLWLHTAEKLPAALRARERQLSADWNVEAWDVPELRRRVPFIDKTDDIAGALFAPRDGLLNPNTLKLHFREKAREAGAVFDDRVLVLGSDYASNPGRVTVRARQYLRALTLEERKAVLCGLGTDPVDLPFQEVDYVVSRVVNAAGAWAGGLARLLGYTSPSKPVRRQICLFDCRDVELAHYGMVVDTSGVYFHPEATNGMSGYCNHEEPEGFNFEYDGEAFFMERIWPALYERSTAFERLKHLTGWAGLYEVSPDESAIIGRVPHGDAAKHVFEAHSFSGHGAMQSFSGGLAIAELMMKGRFETIDCSELSPARFEAGRLVRESAVI